MDATLFFANCEHFKDVIMQAAEGYFHTNSSSPIEKVIIDAKCWIDIDLAGISKLFEIKQELVEKRGLILAICSANGKIRDKLQLSGFLNEIRTTYDNYSVDDAVLYTNIPSREEYVIENRAEHASAFIFAFNPLLNASEEGIHDSYNDSGENNYVDMHSGIYQSVRSGESCFNPIIHRTEPSFASSPSSRPLPSSDSSLAQLSTSKDDPSSLQMVVRSLSSKNTLASPSFESITQPVDSAAVDWIDDHRQYDRHGIIKDSFIDDDDNTL